MDNFTKGTVLRKRLNDLKENLKSFLQQAVRPSGFKATSAGLPHVVARAKAIRLILKQLLANETLEPINYSSISREDLAKLILKIRKAIEKTLYWEDLIRELAELHGERCIKDLERVKEQIKNELIHARKLAEAHIKLLKIKEAIRQELEKLKAEREFINLMLRINEYEKKLKELQFKIKAKREDVKQALFVHVERYVEGLKDNIKKVARDRNLPITDQEIDEIVENAYEESSREDRSDLGFLESTKDLGSSITSKVKSKLADIITEREQQKKGSESTINEDIAALGRRIDEQDDEFGESFLNDNDLKDKIDEVNSLEGKFDKVKTELGEMKKQAKIVQKKCGRSYSEEVLSVDDIGSLDEELLLDLQSKQPVLDKEISALASLEEEIDLSLFEMDEDLLELHNSSLLEPKIGSDNPAPGGVQP